MEDVNFGETQRKGDKSETVEGLIKCANGKHFHPHKVNGQHFVCFPPNPALLVCALTKTISIHSVFLVFIDTDLIFFFYNPVLFLFDFARKTEFISSYMSISRMPCLS